MTQKGGHGDRGRRDTWKTREARDGFHKLFGGENFEGEVQNQPAAKSHCSAAPKLPPEARKTLEEICNRLRPVGDNYVGEWTRFGAYHEAMMMLNAVAATTPEVTLTCNDDALTLTMSPQAHRALNAFICKDKERAMIHASVTVKPSAKENHPPKPLTRLLIKASADHAWTRDELTHLETIHRRLVTHGDQGKAEFSNEAAFNRALDMLSWVQREMPSEVRFAEHTEEFAISCDASSHKALGEFISRKGMELKNKSDILRR